MRTYRIIYNNGTEELVTALSTFSARLSVLKYCKANNLFVFYIELVSEVPFASPFPC